MTHQITAKQRQFCQEYTLDNNATKAAIRAGYSPKQAGRCGSRLLKHPAIKAYLEELQKETREKYKVTKEMVLQELAFIAFADITDYINPDKTVKDLTELPPEKRRAISSLSIHKSVNKTNMTFNINFKTHNKNTALIQLAKHLGFYKDQPEKGGLVKVIYVEAAGEDPNEPKIFKDHKGNILDDEQVRLDYEYSNEEDANGFEPMEP